MITVRMGEEQLNEAMSGLWNDGELKRFRQLTEETVNVWGY